VIDGEEGSEALKDSVGLAGKDPAAVLRKKKTKRALVKGKGNQL